MARREDEERKEEVVKPMEKETIHELMMSQFHDKQFKADYLQLQQQIIVEFKTISEELKMLESFKRKEMLKRQLTQINGFIETHVRGRLKESTKPSLTGEKLSSMIRVNFHGIILPFVSEARCDWDPQVMMRTIPELNQPFNTKQRAPYKVVCETVRFSELRDIEAGMSRAEQAESASIGEGHEEKEPSENTEAEEAENEVKISGEQETWEKVSYGDIEVELEGMSDPF